MIKLVAMSDDEYRVFEARSMKSYAEELSRANDSTPEEAMAQAEATFRRLLPDGRPGSKDQYLFTAVDDQGQRVGAVWFGIRRDRRTPYAYIWDLFLAPEFRGKGLGEHVMRRVEERVRELGHSQIGLNVFGHNLPARRLYERLGYRAASVSMSKDL